MTTTSNVDWSNFSSALALSWYNVSNHVVVILLFITICGSSYFIRRKINNEITEENERKVALEFFASCECFGCCMETGIILSYYGLIVYFIYSFVLIMWRVYSWTVETACVYMPLEDFVESRINLKTALELMLAQVLAAVFVVKLMEFFWFIDSYSEIHHGATLQDCITDLKAHYGLGFAMEFVGTFITRLVSEIIAEKRMGNVGHALDATVGFVVFYVVWPKTGAYFNPTMALASIFGCEGDEFGEHVLVYWLAPVLGAVFASKIHTNMLKDPAAAARGSRSAGTD